MKIFLLASVVVSSHPFPSYVEEEQSNLFSNWPHSNLVERVKVILSLKHLIVKQLTIVSSEHLGGRFEC